MFRDPEPAARMLPSLPLRRQRGHGGWPGGGHHAWWTYGTGVVIIVMAASSAPHSMSAEAATGRCCPAPRLRLQPLTGVHLRSRRSPSQLSAG